MFPYLFSEIYWISRNEDKRSAPKLHSEKHIDSKFKIPAFAGMTYWTESNKFTMYDKLSEL